MSGLGKGSGMPAASSSFSEEKGEKVERRQASASARFVSEDGRHVHTSKTVVQEEHRTVEKVISEPLDSGVMNTLIALEKSRQTSRMAMGALRGEVERLQQALEDSQAECARQAKEIERLNGALVESDRAARAYKGSHDAAVGIHGRLFDVVAAMEGASCATLLRELNASRRDLAASAVSVSNPNSGGPATPASSVSVPSEVLSSSSPCWRCAQAVSAADWSTSLSARETSLLSSLLLSRLLSSSSSALEERERDVCVKFRQCEEMAEKVRAKRAAMKEKSLELTRWEGELTGREEELGLRVNDLEVFRAMLVDQEAGVKEITHAAKQSSLELAASAVAIVNDRLSSSQSTPFSGIVPAGFTSTVRTDAEGHSHSTVSIQFMDVATGQVFDGPQPTDSEVTFTPLMDGSRSTAWTTPMRSLLTAAPLTYTRAETVGEEADDGLVSSRVVSPEELATPSAHLTSNVISGSVSRDPLNMTAEEARAEITARLQRMTGVVGPSPAAPMSAGARDDSVSQSSSRFLRTEERVLSSSMQSRSTEWENESMSPVSGLMGRLLSSELEVPASVSTRSEEPAVPEPAPSSTAVRGQGKGKGKRRQ